ncbi:MAG TPA: cytochrome c biogenesis protein CcsA [Thermoanaerobaculia bacterium]|nr:cytochrome c biogenesis protein CcsA [Thermoanaerobaculia bacterium]
MVDSAAAAAWSGGFGWTALALYAIASALYVLNLYKPSVWTGGAATACAVVGAVTNFGALYARALAVGTVPYRDLLGSMKLFGFFLAVLSVVLELRHRDRALGPVLMPAALFFMLLALLEAPGAGRPAPNPDLKGAIFALHVTLNMLAYAAFAVSCALSILYLAAGRALKSHRLSGPATRLPTLSYLERANRTSLGLGSIALGTGLALGFFWASRVWTPDHPHWALDPKIFFALGTLFFYLFVLVRARRGAPGVSTARLSIAGFALVLLSYTAVNMFVSKLHVFRA